MIDGKLIAHRGACAYAPENTMAAFERARQLGARSIEFDVMLSEDGKAFVFHDHDLKRTTNGRGAFHQTKSGKLKTLDAGSWFGARFSEEKIPCFDEILHWLVQTDMAANIEIKPHSNEVETITTSVLGILHSIWPHHKTMPLISSFDVNVLRLCRSIAPEIPLGLLLHQWQRDWQKTAKELQCYSVHANQRILTDVRIKEIKQYQYKLYAYTINNQRKAKKLLAKGVDAIFSDYPDLLL